MHPVWFLKKPSIDSGSCSSGRGKLDSFFRHEELIKGSRPKVNAEMSYSQYLGSFPKQGTPIQPRKNYNAYYGDPQSVVILRALD